MYETGFQTLQRKMRTLYMVFSCTLLFAVLLLVGFLQYRATIEDAQDRIREDLNRYAQKIRSDDCIDLTAFAQYEVDNDYVLYFWNTFGLEQSQKHNGLGEDYLSTAAVTAYRGAYLSPEDREALWRKISPKEISEKQCAVIDALGTEFYTLQKRVAGMDVTCYLCKDIYNVRRGFALQCGVLALIFLVGSMALYAISSYLSKKALRPVEDNMRRQMDFIHAASHELKSPIAVIMANNEAAEVDGENHAKYREIIDKESRRMSSLVQELLLMASGNTIEFHMKKRAERADTILIGCYEKMYSVAGAQGVSLKIDPGDTDVGAVFVDPMRLEQVLQILVDNAISYGASGGEILLRLRREKKRVLFEVIDHGEGIAPEYAAHIFEQFYRGEKDRSDKSHFGLGLSVAKQLVCGMGGRITYRPTEGGGATFEVSFPRVGKGEKR